MKRRAFISVYDKTGLEDFARNLSEKFEYEIVASEDTYNVLVKAGIEATNVSEYVQNGGFLSKEFNCLNETILASILAETPDVRELNEIESSIVRAFDMVVVNLKPIDEVLNDANEDDPLEGVDVAGLTVLRCASKNYKRVTTIIDKVDYYIALNANEFGRMKLALKAFNYTSNYDREIVTKLAVLLGEKPFKTFNFEKLKDLKYGENPHQRASVYKMDNMIDYEVLDDKELSYNDILNVTEAVNIVSEFYDVNCAAIIRHDKPCGVALGRSLYDAYTKAFDCDPISSFYGVVGFSKPVDEEVAKHLNSMSVEVVVAPDFDKRAVEIFADNADIKLVKLNTTLKDYRRLTVEEVVITPFGVLVQDRNTSELNKEMFKVVTKKKPSPEQIEDAIFAWKTVKHAKTNAVVIARDFKTFAISQGQTNALTAVENGLNYACDNSKDAILASDTVLASEDCIYSAVQGRIGLIIQPGGSVKDPKLIELCDKYELIMITTGIRNYRQ